MFYTDVLQKFLRTGTGPFGKQSLEMKWAQMYFFCHIVEIRLRSKIGSDVVYSLGYAVVIDVGLIHMMHCAYKDEGSIA